MLSGGEKRLENIIVAVITGLFAVFGQWLISREREARLDERLKGVEKRLDTHNNYAEKIGDIQRDIGVLTTEIKNIKERD